MNDASEVLGVIFDCHHRSFTSSSISDTVPVESNCMGSWDCGNNICLAIWQKNFFCRENQNPIFIGFDT